VKDPQKFDKARAAFRRATKGMTEEEVAAAVSAIVQDHRRLDRAPQVTFADTATVTLTEWPGRTTSGTSA
jgi:hypothetical protein